MLRGRISSASGYLTLSSFSLRRTVKRLSTPLKEKLDTRSVSFNYQPFTSNESVGSTRNVNSTDTFSSKEYNATEIAARMEKRSNPPGWRGRAKRWKENQERRLMTDGTPEQVLNIEARTLLMRLRGESDAQAAQNGGLNSEERDEDQDESLSRPERPEPHTELELEIQELSSTGDGLAYSPNKGKDLIYVVPFSVPGDKVLAKTYPQKPDGHIWTKVDFVKLLSPSPKREGVIPPCPHFGTCSGCQLQMLPYSSQLAHKKTIVEKAFKHFSNLDPSLIPPVDDTIGSPLTYGYRTKLTPHYDGCSKSHPWAQGDSPPPFGFTLKNSPKILDIEQCPIGTQIVNEGMKIERKNVAETFWKSRPGKTVLLRESTRRELLPQSEIAKAVTNGTDAAAARVGAIQDLSSLPLEYSGDPTSTSIQFPSPTSPEITYTYPSLGFRDTKTYTSDNKAFTTEHIGPFTFTTRANSFFQNNNSILPTFLSYIRENLLPKNTSTNLVNTGDREPAASTKIKYLLDAYCGSGLFSIALASEFSSVLGIDIDALSIQCARENAKINTTSSSKPKNSEGSNLGFIAADARAIFTDVPFPPDQTLCVIDPPRKGASRDFLQQLCAFGPKRVVYVSCNVHTQARDVGMLVAGFGADGSASGRGKSWRYKIEKLGGFDFFPQTGHVEGVCFLNRVQDGE